MRNELMLAHALDEQRRRLERRTAELVAVAAVAPDPDYAARLIDNAIDARERCATADRWGDRP